MIKERLAALRKEMEKENIDAVMIPTSDFHQSEYVGDYFKAREYMSGFTGSAGTLVVLRDKAGLFTDGRYFLQAEDQLKGSTITLFKSGEEGVPTIDEFLANEMKDGSTLAFDGRLLGVKSGNHYADKLAKKNITVRFDLDLVDRVWSDRPALSAEKAFLLEDSQTGKSTESKIKDIREKMEEKSADIHIVASLDDIAWILNLRGNDVECNPVVLSYLAIEKESVKYFVNETVLTDEIRASFAKVGVEVRPYNDVYAYAADIAEGKTIMVDENKVNFSLVKGLKKGVNVVFEANPSTLMKACKNAVELENMRRCHIKDGVAVTKFLYWLKKNIGQIPMTEISAADRLLEFRKEQEGFIELSFDTISGYAEHGAIIHYEPTKETDVPLKAENFLLVDSGAQYCDGTTDITRTVALGALSDEQREHYTMVLRATINLARARFPYGVCGANLDILAREPFWEKGLDYKHGTGHGVGCLLNVHEGPQNFHFNKNRASCLTVLEEGMITSDEPGIYIAGSHGIRIENLIAVKKAEKNEYGQFMEFETLTCAPIDLDAAVTEQMSEPEKQWLNSYHAWVKKTLAPYLTKEENEWLKEYARDI